MKTGDIVKIEGGFFKADNGTFLVKHSPGDPSWSGSDYSLRKCNKKGVESESKYSTSFWPLMVTVSSRDKRIEAMEHNEANATIEIIGSVKVYELNVKQSIGWNDYETKEIATEKRYQELLANKYIKLETISESTNEQKAELSVPVLAEEEATPTVEVLEIEYKFKIGDKVNWENSNGVNLGVRTVIRLDERCGRPTYYIDPIDTPWFSISEEELTIITVKEPKTSITQPIEETPAPETTQDTYKQVEIEEGYIYNMHFKAWEKTIEEIEEELTKREILFTNMGDKTGCYNLSFEQAKEVKRISDINGSICFIDSKTPTTQEQPEAQEEFIQASKRQLYALYLATKIKTTDLVISKSDAGKLISKSLKGENITKELEIFITCGEVETSITASPISLPHIEEEEIQDEEPIETMEFDDILSKFDSIDVKEIDKITKEDRIYCEMHEKIYKQAYLAYSEVLEKLKNIQQIQKEETKTARENGILRENDHGAYEYVSEYSDGGTTNIRRSLEKTTQKFISSIVYYFKRTYQIDIKYSEYKEQTELLTVDFVLEKYIYSHLDGFNFKEKAIDEIKQKAHMPQQYYEYRKYWNYEVKGKSIKFRTNIDSIKPALYFYDSNETNIIDCYSYNKVDDFTSYENGNTNIKFLSSTYALDFAKRYLGYIEMTDAEREEYKKKASSY